MFKYLQCKCNVLFDCILSRNQSVLKWSMNGISHTVVDVTHRRPSSIANAQIHTPALLVFIDIYFTNKIHNQRNGGISAQLSLQLFAKSICNL